MSYFAAKYSALLLLLLFFGALQALPFTPKAAARNRGGVFAHLNLGKLNKDRNQPEGSPRGSAKSSSITDGVCSCDPNRPPAELLAEYREDISSEPHPMLLLSQMAEDIHQKESCTSLCSGTHSNQLEEEIIAKVRSIIMKYLNVNVSQDRNRGPCPSWYNVTFHPKRYPRYLVEVVCSNPSDDSSEKDNSCSYCSNDKAHTQRRGHCFRYPLALREVQILTIDPNELNCELPDGTPPTWNKCFLPDVGVGCKCV